MKFRTNRVHEELSDDTPRSGYGGGNNIKDGGERVDGAKHRRISHGLAGVQRVGVRDSAGWP